MSEMIQTKNLTRIYQMGNTAVHAVENLTIAVEAGTMTAFIGRSGSGKTTLLNMISGLDLPTAGEVWFQDKRVDQLNEEGRRLLRRDHMGFIFQSFGLLPLLTAMENVSIPLRMRYTNARERDERVMQALAWVGLGDRAHHRTYELSGGQQQRVAIARALVSKPALVLADEPTGQLDSITGQRIIDLLLQLVREQGITVLMVTHDPKVIRSADVVHELRDGHLLKSHSV